MAGDVGLAIDGGEKTFHLHYFAGGRIARAMLNQKEGPAGRPSFGVILSLVSGPSSASGEQGYIAAVNGLRDDIGFVARPGVHVFDRRNANVRVSRGGARNKNEEESEKRNSYVEGRWIGRSGGQRVAKFGCPPGIRTPIACSRGRCPSR